VRDGVCFQGQMCEGSERLHTNLLTIRSAVRLIGIYAKVTVIGVLIICTKCTDLN